MKSTNQPERCSAIHCLTVFIVIATTLAACLLLACLLAEKLLVPLLEPEALEFRVDSFSSSNITNFENDSFLVTFDAEVGLTAWNPNKNVFFSFDRAVANLYHGPERIGRAVMPPFSLGGKSQAELTVSFPALMGTRAEASDGQETRLKITYEKMVKRRTDLYFVFCDGLVLDEKVMPRTCQVGMPSTKRDWN